MRAKAKKEGLYETAKTTRAKKAPKSHNPSK